MGPLSQPDDNMIPGQTYTFQLNESGLQWPASASDVQAALIANAPSFLSDLQVTSPFTTSLYNCQFTYSGDGSDVISDVANSIVAAANQGTGKTFTFVGAVPDTAQSVTVTPGNAVAKVTDSVTSAVNNAVNTVVTNASKTTATAAQNLLTPVEIAFGIVAIVIIAIIFTAGKSGGVNISELGASVGGAK